MKVVISLIIVSLAAFYFNQNIKRKAVYYYFFATVIACLIIYLSWGTAYRLLPSWLRPIINLFSKASLASALFIIVMYIAILPRKSIYFKHLMPIRAELSIIATILTLGHNIGYGKRYFSALFAGGNLPVNLYYAALVSLTMIVIMLPLFITSFKFVRKRMKVKDWKRLQKTAYLFYFLMWLHVVLIYAPSAHKGAFDARLTLGIYHVVYSVYILVRARRLILQNNGSALATGIATSIVVLALLGANLLVQFYVFETRQVDEQSMAQLAISPDAQRATLSSSQLAERTENTEYTEDAERSTTNSQATTQSATTTDATTRTTYKDGQYQGAADGYVDDIIVSVIIEDGLISDIIIEEEQEDLEYMILAEDVIDDILAQNDTAVDTISGATTSSEAIILAVEEALASAR